MKRSRSSGKLLNSDRELTDEELYKLILQAYEETKDLEQLQMTIKNIMTDDPERIRNAYRKVVEIKARNRTTSEQRLDTPSRPAALAVFVADSGDNSRTSQRRKSSQSAKAKGMSVILETFAAREFGGLDRLKNDLAALSRMQHQNLLNLVAFNFLKGTRLSLDFDLASTSYATLLEMFSEEAGDEASLNGCEMACILAQACLGLMFLNDCAIPAMKPLELDPAACLRTDNIILTERGLIKLSGHHQVIRLPPRRRLSNGQPDQVIAQDVQGRSQQYTAHRMAMLLYELDHPRHQQLSTLSRCSSAERKLLDERYARLFSMCADWQLERPLDLRSVLYSEFICEQTSAISSYQTPLEFVFATRFG